MEKKFFNLRTCGILLILCAALPLLLLNSWAFTSEHLMQRLVSFGMILDWSYSLEFSVSKLVGICYRSSLFFSIVLIPLGVLFIIRPKALFYRNKLKSAVELCVLSFFCAFYIFAMIVNIIRVDGSECFPFGLYIFSEFIITVSLISAKVFVNKQLRIPLTEFPLGKNIQIG